MNLKFVFGFLILFLIGLGVGYLVHTPTEVPAKTTHSYIMNLYRIDGFPVCVYYFPANLPPNSTGPSQWTAFDNSPNRNPVFPGNLNVSWVFQQLMPAFSFGNISGWIKLIRTYSPQFREGYVQMMGDAVPVSYSNGIVYVSASDGVLYALNAYTGKPVFIAMMPDTLMSQPLIYGGMVYVGLGGAFFTYGQGLLNAYGGGHRGQFTGLSGLMALNSTTGKPVWFFITKSQVMPTPVILNGVVYFDDGDGYMYALNATSGSEVWRIGSFGTANMASLDYANDSGRIILIAGFSSAYPVNYSSLVGVSTNGTVLWRTPLPFTYDSGPGDAVMSVYGNYLVDGFISGYPVRHGPLFNETLVREVVMTLNVTDGRLIWLRNVSGYVLPTGANNGESPSVVKGMILVNDRKDHMIYALNLSDGRELWNDSLVPAAPGLIGPVYVDGLVLNPDFQYIQVINATTGKVVNLYPVGQDTVIDTPTVVGDTVFVDGGFGYVEAISLYYLVHNTTSIFQIFSSKLVSAETCVGMS